MTFKTFAYLLFIFKIINPYYVDFLQTINETVFVKRKTPSQKCFSISLLATHTLETSHPF